MSERFTDMLRKKFPIRAERAANGSRGAAITMNCLECVGGSIADAKACTARDCFLWPYSPAGRAHRKQSK